MFRTAIAAISIAAAMAGCSAAPAKPAADVKPPCAAGEVLFWVGIYHDFPCDLTADNTLTLLGGTEAECDHAGGRWIYEACENADF